MLLYREMFYYYLYMFNILIYRYWNENWIDIFFYVVVKVNFIFVYWSIIKWWGYVNIRVVVKVFFYVNWNVEFYVLWNIKFK